MRCEWDHAPFGAAPVGAFCPQESLLLWAALLLSRAQVDTASSFPVLGSSFLCSGLGTASCLGVACGWDPASSTWPHS